MTLLPGKQLKHAVLCALAEQIYHHSGGDVIRDGVSTWFGRIRASLSGSRRSSTSSRNPGRSASVVQASHVHLGLTSLTVERAAGSSATLARSAESASAAAELQPAMLQPAASTESSTESPQGIRRTSPTGTEARTSPTPARIRASLAGMWGGAAASQSNLSVHRPIRRMRLLDQLELPREVTDGTVLYLSPHYRLLPASGGSVTPGVQSNMFMELSAQLGSLGIKVVSVAGATSSANQPALFLLLLCPGFFSCPELVEETAQALKGMLKRPRAASFGTCRRMLGAAEGNGGAGGADLGTESSLSSEHSWQEDDSLRLEGLQRQNSLGSQLRSRFSRGFRRESRALVPLMSTAMPYGDYVRTCPPDLKDLGLFEANFDLWPECAALQPTAIKIAIRHLPGNQHAARHPSRTNAAATRDTPSAPQLVMSRRPQPGEPVVAGGESLRRRHERRQQRHEPIHLPPRTEPLRPQPRAAEERVLRRVWLGAGAGSGQPAQRAAEGEAGAVGGRPSLGPFPLRPSVRRMPEVGTAVGLGGGAPQAARSGSPLAARLTETDATPLPASPPPSDRAAKRTSSLAVNRQQQLSGGPRGRQLFQQL